MTQKNMLYFRHDFNARNDEKVVRLRSRYGVEGYGLFFMLIERLAEASDHKATTDYDVHAFELHCSAEMLRSVVEDFGLFVVDKERGLFYSQSLLRRLENLDAVSEKRRAAANRRWSKQADDANATQTDASALQKNATLKREEEKRGEEKEEKREEPPIMPPANGGEGESKVQQVFRRPTVEEVQAYCQERGNGISASEFVDYYDSVGWKVGKKEMKDWRAAVRTWERNRKAEVRQSATNPNLGVGEYISPDGRRTYGDGRATVPMNATKRLSTQEIWDSGSQHWIVL